jgi:hypothetical protein
MSAGTGRPAEILPLKVSPALPISILKRPFEAGWGGGEPMPGEAPGGQPERSRVEETAVSKNRARMPEKKFMEE